MKPRMKRQRLVIFGLFSSFFIFLMLAAGWYFSRDALAITPWTDFLEDNERNGLMQAVTQPIMQELHDPVLRVPGLIFNVDQTKRQAGGKMVVVEGSPQRSTSTDNLLNGVIAHWLDLGLALEFERGNLLATDKYGNVYSAMVIAADELNPSRVMLTRMTESEESLLRLEKMKAPLPEWQANLLPKLPDNEDSAEAGAEGRPGYSMMFSIHAGPKQALEVIRNELESRGWEIFKEAFGEKSSAQGLIIADSITMIFRHQTAPLGCQLMIGNDPENRRNTSQVFISLF